MQFNVRYLQRGKKELKNHCFTVLSLDFPLSLVHVSENIGK